VTLRRVLVELTMMEQRYRAGLEVGSRGGTAWLPTSSTWRRSARRVVMVNTPIRCAPPHRSPALLPRPCLHPSCWRPRSILVSRIFGSCLGTGGQQ
jgi:hypothetical protein